MFSKSKPVSANIKMEERYWLYTNYGCFKENTLHKSKNLTIIKPINLGMYQPLIFKIEIAATPYSFLAMKLNKILDHTSLN